MTVDGTPAPEIKSAPANSTGEPGTRITPAFWMPVDRTLAWLAFGSAETDLDAAYYFGASIWHAAEPDRIVEWLADIGDAGTFSSDYWPAEFASLEQRVTNRAAQTTRFQAAMAEAKQKRAEEKARAEALGNPKRTPSTPWPKLTEAHLKEAATQLLEELEACLPDAASKHSALWAASEKLRRAIANGEIRAYGWRGHGPDFSDQHTPLPLRERIPDDLCAAPVTITQNGLLSFARGDGSFGNYDVLWTDLLIDSEELLRVHPYVPDDRPSAPYDPPLPEFKRDRGGKNADFDWRPFEEECRQYLQSLSAKPAGGDLKRLLKSHMRWWAKEKMEQKPDATKPARRTVDRKTNDLFPILLSEISQRSGHNRA